MGGIVCEIPRKAILRFEEVPRLPGQVRQFDSQIRQLYAHPTIAQSVNDENPHGAREVCLILSKDDFTASDRATLLHVVESLYESYQT